MQTRILRIFDDADHGRDEFLMASKFLGRDGWRLVDDVVLKKDGDFHGGSAEIDFDGQGAVAHRERDLSTRRQRLRFFITRVTKIRVRRLAAIRRG